MLHRLTSLRELDFRELMAVYAGSNQENASEMYPELSEGQAALQVEQDFYSYLRDCFFRTEGAYYAVWQLSGRYVSALRIEPYKDGVLLAALETAPDQRRKGYAEKLIRQVLASERKVYSHVGKQNLPSLKIHEKCGFQRTSEQAMYIDGSVNEKCCTLCFEIGNDVP